MVEINHLLFWGMFGLCFEILFTAISDLYSKRVGYPASQIGIRIWDYRYLSNNMHWKGIVSYAHFPVWIVFGILVELVDKLLK